MSKKENTIDKTVFSELSVAQAINGGSISTVQNVTDEALAKFIEGQDRAKTETKEGKDLKKKGKAFQVSGSLIRKYLETQGLTNPIVKWVGPEQMKAHQTVPKDILVSGIYRVSVKEDANVLTNGSNQSSFIDVPKTGRASSYKGGDIWYQRVAPDELQNYYDVCKQLTNKEDDLPKLVTEYYSRGAVPKEVRKQWPKEIAEIANHPDAKEAYDALCKKVSESSATLFNQNLNNTPNNIYAIFTHFFRVNGQLYIMAGTEKGKPLAVMIPSTDQWEKEWKVVRIHAEPKKAGQPEVLVSFDFYNKKEKIEVTYKVRIEVRWTHGKFGSAPEGKTYKEWLYSDLAWNTVLT